MALETDLNINPYFDDFDENKDFNRILFRPAVPLQARELTQLQSILQNQIERFGHYQFKEGSIIKGCNFSFDNKLKYAKINDKDTNNQDVVMSDFGVGDFIVNQANVVARVENTATGLETQNPDLNTLFFHYLNTGTAGEKTFAQGETIEVFPASSGIANVQSTNNTIAAFNNSDIIELVTDGAGTGFTANIITIASGTTLSTVNVTANGTGFTPDDDTTVKITFANGDLANSTVNDNFTINLKPINTVTIANNSFESGSNIQFHSVGNSYSMTVNDGVIFQKGHFQRFAEQSIVVSRYTDQPDQLMVGVQTTEAIVNSSVDTTLLDNASGFNNENAPGADRLKLTPTLIVNTTTNALANDNFLAICEFETGRPLQMNQKAQLNRLGDQLARRTHEESGDYVVDPFQLSTQRIAGNTTSLALNIGAGVGYNKGHRFETVNSSRAIIEKASTSNTVTGQSINLSYGNYIRLDNVYGDFGHANNDTVVLTDGDFNAHTSPNSAVPSSVSSSAVTYDSTTRNIIGTARVRSIEAINNNNNNHNSEYHLYVYDVKMNTGQDFKNVRGVVHYSGTVSGLSETNDSVFGIGDVVDNQYKLNDASLDSLVFPLGQLGVKDVANGASYTFKRRLKNQTIAAGGGLTINLAGDEQFTFGDGTVSNNNEKQFIIIPRENVNAAAAVDSSVDVAASNNTVTNIDSTSDVKVGDLFFLNTSGPFQIRSVVNSTAVTVDSNPGALTGATMLRTYQNNYPISLDDNTNANVVISSSSTTAVIDIDDTLTGSLTCDVIFNVKNTNANKVNKTVKTTEVALDVDSNDGGTTGPWSLGVVDAFDLLSVNKGSGATTSNSSNFDGFSTDVTSEFEIVSGQKDGFYGLSKLKKVAGSTLAISSGDQFKVSFRHFQKGATQGFFSVNSYPVDDANTANTTAVTTQEIPIFISPKSGKEFSLRDSLDFRPEVSNTAVEEGDCTGGSATVNPGSAEKIDEVSAIPTPDTNFTGDVTFYLPRKDRLIIQNNRLHILKGVPSTNPSLPVMPDDAMQLGQIDVPVYPSLASPEARRDRRPDLAVTIKATQLKRYTMEDIRAIDDRVTNLEYYSSLNFLEKFTADKVIPGRTDPTTNRFKNGFIVDNFSSFTTGNPLNTEFKAGFDSARSLLVSRFENYSLPLQFKSGNKISRSNDLIFPNYTNRKIIRQERATRQRKVTSALWQYNGTVNLFPDYLAGVDNVKSPEAAVQIDIDAASGTLALINELNKIAPQQFTSEQVISDRTNSRVISSVPSDTQVTNAVEVVQTQRIRRSTTQLSARARTTRRTVGDFVTDLAFQPYIPGTVIRFVATGLRPGMRHYVFFDGRNMTSRCQPANRSNPFDSVNVDRRLSSSRARRMIQPKGALGDALTADSSGRITGLFRVPANTFFAGEREFIITDVTTTSQLPDAVSIANAKFNCYNFTATKGDVITSTRRAMPRASLRQSTFTRSNRTVEQVITPLPPAEVTIIENHIEVPTPVEVPVPVPGPTVFVPGEPAPPVIVVTPGEPIEVPVPVEVFVPVPVDPPAPPEDLDGLDLPLPFELPDFRFEGEFGIGGADPLAQTFMLDRNQFDGTSTGYLTYVDIFFAGKDMKRGCTVEIRNTENGVPGPEVLPFSRTHLDASDISIPSNPATSKGTATRFVFTSPVAVNADQEYCVVILPDGNSPEYAVFTAKAGETNLGTTRAHNQDWGTGTMFLSTNNRTWTEYVDEDLTFSVGAAIFKTLDCDVTLENEDVEFFTSNSSNIVGSFTPGEEVFKHAANQTGGVIVNKGNSTLVATTSNGVNWTSMTGLSAGSRIVLTANATTYDVVEVESIANSSTLTLRGAPTFTDATANVIFTPTGTLKQIDSNTSVLFVDDSSATNTSFLFSNGDVIIGTESLANCTINEVSDTNMSYIEPRIYRNMPTGTQIGTTIKAIKSSSNTEYQDHTIMALNDRFYSPLPIKVQSRSNEIATNGGSKSVNVNHRMTSLGHYLGGSIDLQSQELLVYENIINNSSTDEYKGDDGQAQAKYVSRTIELAEGLDAEDLRVFINAYQPANTDIEIYAKVLNAEDPENFEDKVWSKLQRVGLNQTKISSTKDRDDVIEYEFEFVDTPDTTVKDGKVILTSGSKTITGSGTTLQTDYAVGDLIKITNSSDIDDYFITTVTERASETSITVADAATFTSIGSKHSKVDTTHLNQVFRDPGAATNFEATYYNSSNVKFVGYKYLAIKIVMLADSTALSPYVQDYRAIAVSL